MLEEISKKQVGLEGVPSGEIRGGRVGFRVRTVNSGTAHFSKAQLKTTLRTVSVIAIATKPLVVFLQEPARSGGILFPTAAAKGLQDERFKGL